MSFEMKLHQRIEDRDSRLLVGLDPHPGKIPESFVQSIGDPGIEDVLFQYFKNVVDYSRDYAAAFKPQIAFFEAYGLAGMKSFARLVQYLQSHDELIIVDGKRNDIGSTASAYAQAYFDDKSDFSGHALTVNGYLGYDGIKPFLQYPEKGIFVLVKTSNPSSGDFQDLHMKSGEPLYETVARQITEWYRPNLDEMGFGPIGVVVGATYPDHMKALRGILPHSVFLVPGFGAQGGSQDAVRAAFLANGRGAIINSSRQINFPEGFEDNGFEAVREADRSSRDLINQLAKD